MIKGSFLRKKSPTGLVLSFVYFIFTIVIFSNSMQGGWPGLQIIYLLFPFGLLLTFAISGFSLQWEVVQTIAVFSAYINIIILYFIGRKIEELVKPFLKGK